jgi:hypothetical protein
MTSTRFMARQFMAPQRAIGYIAVLLSALSAATGCGKSDKGPPPGANTTIAPPDVSIELPMDPLATSTKSADSTGKPSATQGDKK